ncbi:alpha-hydroxy acid oxidase [Burkholderia thailandensis]|uniref:Dehydrogenase, FMN-dependent family n=1 Tax=Burkholderia thailandensis (strain ATCC 700388 / DSM 13276 / CCUG 48851 / CIP 106301 / E264) TaxID=271848 RepID=Q2T739_BURTA|nr:alpha-hydroxy acid oxidase [Burkholderia thailandensis]ABC35108.1 dehydrogenase, FMN-dependent family [Burkholderia thailandensis E264]AHI75582.1 FMN-dependent dehydrogenase family protein [Burkholderia thailandensis 2002721723]AIP29383.1 FMN-dependent dehydrogenase family protein [Burkholderia thailandensis E264]AIS98290.1 FMN-dependent dehydrogenase family protein [Burkholderia thailandensis MSMB59]AIT23679.1 FMN-dependent dehydrogenase family protein [Burkholderia thailandensis E254]
MSTVTSPIVEQSPPAAGAAARPPRVLRDVLSLHDFEAKARRALPRPIFGYVSGAAEDNRTRDDNRAVFDEYGFVTRVLRDVSQRRQGVELFGRRYASPFGIAPMGIHALSTYRGDVVLARAAQRAGIASIMSGSSLIPLEDVAAAAPGTWFQAYLPGDAGRIRALVERVARAGYRTLVVTVDIPVSANRENNVRSGFSTPLRPSPRLFWDGLTRPRWLLRTFARTLLAHGMPHFENSFATRGAPILSANVLRDFSARDHLSWAHVRRIREQWTGELVIKGVLSVDDALIAREAGADGIILSNHGGRQLDGAVSPMRILRDVVQAVGDGYPVMIDSGFRRGSDVLKAVALGARMVFVGRPFNYAAAVAGEAGVAHAIALLREEVDRNLAMLGVNSCEQLSPDVLIRKR